MTPPDSYFQDPDFRALEAVFHDYVAQGQGRNPTWLAAKTGLSIKRCCQGMVAGGWLQRIAAISSDAAAVTRDQVAVSQGKLVGDVASINARDIQRFLELEELAHAELLARLKGTGTVKSTMKDAEVVKLFVTAVEKRRVMMGLGDGAPPVNPLAKLLEGSLGGETTTSFQLDPKKLEAPPELPAMPGMTSDDVPEDPHRPLDPEEKEMLRP